MTAQLHAAAQRPKTIVLADLWRRYERTRELAVRDQLVLAYSPLVKHAAGRVAARVPAHVEFADLLSDGLEGVIQAVERYDPERDASFETFAYVRIRGAIIDGLRARDWVPRSVRDHARRIEHATTELTTLLQRAPTGDELCAELGIEAARLDAQLQLIADAHIVPLDEPWSGGGDEGGRLTPLDTLSDPDASDPEASGDARDLRERLGRAIAQLPERERQIMDLRYHHEMKYIEIGDILGISESRVCQLHAKAALSLRGLLTQERPAAPAPVREDVRCIA
jgi:RNA polymerase sigma factor for flagellar operon FliA